MKKCRWLVILKCTMQHDLLGKTKYMIIWLYISRRKIWKVEAESKKEIFDRGLSFLPILYTNCDLLGK
jgi:hypothetical protein